MMKKDKNCIFCKIAGHELNADIVYEDEMIIAFMDIAPINPGHILVIPKEHHVGSSSIPENIAGRMFLVASRLAVACKRVLETDGYNLHLSDGYCAGQDIPHSHLHMIPRKVDDNFHWNWRKLEIGEGELKNTALEIKKKLKLNIEK
jgi:histidine triad (HIT) family protein